MTAETLFGEPVPDRTRRTGIGSHHSAASSTDEWLTPRWLVDRLAAPCGAFELDPCAPWPTAVEHLTVEDNGLRREWRGSVFLNPPYSDVARWVARLAEHGTGCALVFARTETAWWHDDIWPKAAGVLFLRSRVTFGYPDGSVSRYNAGGPSALVSYGAVELHRLARVADLGKIVRL